MPQHPTCPVPCGWTGICLCDPPCPNPSEGRKVTVTAPFVTGLGKVDFAVVGGRCYQFSHDGEGNPVEAVDVTDIPEADEDWFANATLRLPEDRDGGPDPLRSAEPKL